jgi:proteic killer suppression protein
VWGGVSSRNLPHNIQDRALRKLRMIDAARTINDLRTPPSNRPEALSGDRLGQMSIRISGQWRICFRWHNGAVHDVEIVDCH